MRLIEIPDDGIVRIPIMSGEDTVGERHIDLSHMPTIEIEQVRHGRWEMKSTCGPHTEKPHCSVCDKIPKSICFEPYCPNCGAKMDGDKYAN